MKNSIVLMSLLQAKSLRNDFGKRWGSNLLLFFSIFVFCSSIDAFAATIRYVKPGGTGNGSSWSLALGNVQNAINVSNRGDEVWIAAGTYVDARATGNYTSSDGSTVSIATGTPTISLKENVNIYGGFAGNETSKTYGAVGGRIKGQNETVLSGNSSHYVVTNSGSISTETYIDGISIAYGRTSGSGAGCSLEGNFYLYNCTFRNNNASSDSGGAGRIVLGRVRMENCLIYDNNANGAGGGFYIDSPSASFLNCKFINNKSGNNGGAIFSTTSPTFVNCLISNNEASNLGGGLFANGGMRIINCTVVKNKGASDGSGMYCGGSALVKNCIIWGNVSTSAGNTKEINNGSVTNTGMSGTLFPGSNNVTLSYSNTNNIVGDTGPNFFYPSTTAGVISTTLALSANWANDGGSFGVNKGDNNSYTSLAPGTIPVVPNYDVAGKNRIIGGIIDMGAFEVNATSLATITIDAASLFQYYDGNAKICTATTIPGLPTILPSNILWKFMQGGVEVLPINPGSYDVSAIIDHQDWRGRASGVLVISPAKPKIFVRANDKSRVYGIANPSNDAVIKDAGGVVLSEATLKTAGDLAGTLSFTSSAIITSNVGNTYTITPAGFTSSKYDIVFQDGVLTITKAAITGITFPDGTYTFDNTAKSVLISGSLPSGTAAAYTNNTQTNAGTYSATVSITGSNYTTLNLTSTLKINAKPITVTASFNAKSYSNDPLTDPTPFFNCDVAIASFGGSWGGALTRTAGETIAGSPYAYGQGTLSAGPNFAITFVSANFVIVPKTLSITGLTIADRPYVAADVNAPISSWGTLQGVVGADVVSLNTTGITASYANDAKESGKVVAAWSTNPIPLQGAQSGNYYLTMPTVNGNIGFASTTITLSYPSLVYDGLSKASNITASHSPSEGGDVTTYTFYLKGTTTVAIPKDAGDYDVKVVVAGASYNATKTETFTIAKKPLTVTVGSVSKTYDGNTTAAIGTLLLNDVVASDAGSVAVAATSASYDTKNVGASNKTVTVNGVSISGTRSANYSIGNSAVNIGSSILSKTLAVTGLTAQNKVYNGLTGATILGSSSSSDIVSGDVVTLTSPTTGTFASSNVANGIAVSAVVVKSGADNGNYTLVQPVLSANITQAPLSISFPSVTKTYDGTTLATIPALTVSGTQNGDIITAIGGAATFDNKNVASGKTVTVTGVVFGGSLLNNYSYPSSATNNLGIIDSKSIIITPDSIAASAILAESFSKVYGNVDPLFTYTFSPTLATGDAFSGLLSRANLSTQDVGSYSINLGSLSAGGNYTLQLTSTPVLFNIVKKAITVTVGSVSKVYDGSTTASIGSLSLNDIEVADNANVTVSAMSALYSSSAAGLNKSVLVSGVALSGSKSGNYKIAATASNATSTITKADVSGVTFSGSTVVFDNSAKAISISGVLPAGATVSYSTNGVANTQGGTNAGTYNVTATILGGTNYNDLTLNATLVITLAEIDGSGVPFVSKSFVYDNTSKSIVLGGTLPVGTSVVYSNNSASNVGVYHATATISGSNYKTLVLLADLTITQKPITITANNGTKVYGNANPTFTYSITSGSLAVNDVLGGVVALKNGGSNVNSYSIDEFSGLTILNGAQDHKANYLITTVNGLFSITARPLSYASIVANSKVYDGSTTATLTLGALQNIYLGDAITTSYVATFNTKNVGAAKAVAATFTLSGAAAGNYSFAQPTGLTANITTRSLTADGFTIASKVADTFDAATIQSWGNLTPIATGDVGKVSINQTGVTAKFPQVIVGQNLLITLSTLTLTGLEAANYTLVQPTGLLASIGSGPAVFTWGAATSNQTVPYDGLTHAMSITVTDGVNPILATISYVKDGVTVTSPSAPINAGVYSVTVTSKDPSYVGSVNGILTITPLPLTLTFASITKEYDKTISAAMPAINVSGWILADQAPAKVTVIPTIAEYDNPNFGLNNHIVTVSGISLAGTSKDNYTFSTAITNSSCSVTKRGSVTPAYKPVVTFNPLTKVFDGLTNVPSIPTFYVSNLLAGDGFTVTTNNIANITYATATVGLGNKEVNAINLVPETGKEFVALNYELPTTSQNLVSSISKSLPLTTSITFPNLWKYYDGNTKVVTMPASSQFVISGLQGSFVDVHVDTLLAVASFDSKNVGARTVTISGLQFTGADVANYDLPTMAVNSSSEIKMRIIPPPSLSVQFSPITKIYDGNTSVPSNPTLTVSGLAIPTDVVTATTTIDKVSFDTPNVGTGKTVTASGIVYGGADVGNYNMAAFPTATNGLCSITKKPLIAGTLSFPDQKRIYDGTKNVATMPVISINLPNPNNIGIDYTGAIAQFNDKSVGTGKVVTISNFKYTGSDTLNYVLPIIATNNNSEIYRDPEPKNIVVVFDPVIKSYDGTNDATNYVQNIALAGTFGADVVVVSFASASYDDENVGVDKPVTVRGLQFGGTDAGNYSISSVKTINNGVINRIPAPKLTLSIDPQTKVYDRTVIVKNTTNLNLQVSGILPVDRNNPAWVLPVSVSVAKAKYDSKVWGIGNKTVKVPLVVNSTLASSKNYAWPDTIYNYNSTIERKDLTVYTSSQIEMDSVVKTYDGNILIPNSLLPNLTFNPIAIGADDVVATALDGHFDNKNVGVPKSVTISIVDYTGADFDNYILPSAIVATKGRISKKPIPPIGTRLSIADQKMVYNGGVKADSIPRISVAGLELGDAVTIKGTAATYDSPNAGNAKDLVVSGLKYSGLDAFNYSFTETSVTNSNSVILPKPITADFAAISKAYDGSNVAPNPINLILTGVLSSDLGNVTASGNSARFDNKNVGINKKVSVYGVGLSGAQAGNYTVVDSCWNSKNSITIDNSINGARIVALNPISKEYDGNANLQIASSQLRLSGTIAGDDVSIVTQNFTGLFKSLNAATNLPFAIPSVQLTGADAANYGSALRLDTVATISKFALQITPLDTNKHFNEVDPIIKYTLNRQMPVSESLTGQLSRTFPTTDDVDSYLINQGTLVEGNNPNYAITFVPGAKFTIVSDIYILRKYGYVLLVDNHDNRFSGYQWYKGGQEIPGAKGQYYYPESKILCGLYKVKVTLVQGGKQVFSMNRNEEGCKSLQNYLLYPKVATVSGNVFIKNIAGSNLDLPKELVVDDNCDAEITIFSMDGSQISSIRLGSIEDVILKVPSTSGLYIVKVIKDGVELMNEKLIVK